MLTRDKTYRTDVPDRERLRRDKDVTVHHRTTARPVQFIPQLHVGSGVSVLELLGREPEKNNPPLIKKR